MKKIFTLLLGLFVFFFLHSAEEKVIWEESFRKDGPLENAGYSVYRKNPKDVFEVKNGVLNLSCFNAPYKGTYLRKPVPIVPKGEFSFEIRTCTNGKLNSDNSSLKIHYGQHVFAFRHPHWERYDLEKKRWYVAGKINDSKWHKCKVRFDAEKKLAEYFIDDMEFPVSVNEEFLYKPKTLPFFGVENYGLSQENVDYSLRNVKVTEIPASAESSTVRLNGTSLFQGLSASEWPLEALVKKLGEETLQVYTLETPGAHVDNGANFFDLYPKPPRRGSVLPKNIILADMPLTAVPPYALQQILDSVNAGGRLIILRGYFSLNKGNYAGSVLEKILPVDVKDKWSEPKILADASVVTRNGKAVIAIRKYGKGKVIAALEMPHLGKVGESLLEYDFEKGSR